MDIWFCSHRLSKGQSKMRIIVNIRVLLNVTHAITISAIDAVERVLRSESWRACGRREVRRYVGDERSQTQLRILICRVPHVHVTFVCLISTIFAAIWRICVVFASSNAKCVACSITIWTHSLFGFEQQCFRESI